MQYPLSSTRYTDLCINIVYSFIKRYFVIQQTVLFEKSSVRSKIVLLRVFSYEQTWIKKKSFIRFYW